MNLILTNFGHRFITEQLKVNSEAGLRADPRTAIMLQVLTEKMIPVGDVEIYRELINSGYLEINNSLDLDAINFKYKTNPLENVTKIVFEFTTKCNFSCAHCRNGSMEKTTETDIGKLKSVADAFCLLNIKRFDFIGGEVSKYGNGWLQLANHINSKKDKTVAIYTNGWWLEQTDFIAAGKFYTNDTEYLSDLYQNGLTHILFSIDGHEADHDKSRKHHGLYRRIISSFDRIKMLGIEPRISAVLFEDLDPETVKSLVNIATKMYNLPNSMDAQVKLRYLAGDDTNQFSHFIDIGSGVNLKKNRREIASILPELLNCKAFYRPSPALRIMANGNLSVCPLLDAGEDYGNIHEKSMIGILNNFQDSFLYKLNAGKHVRNYLQYLDTSIFGEHYDHLCSIRVILILLAKYINEEKELNSETLLAINRRIARYSGHER
jgi:MoaA/NifB/PqqE/SkfB family radical SAM enzyme